MLFTKVVKVMLLFVRCVCWLQQLKHTPYPVNKSGWCIFSFELRSSTPNRETILNKHKLIQLSVVQEENMHQNNLFFVVRSVRFNYFNQVNQQNQRTNTGTVLRTLWTQNLSCLDSFRKNFWKRCQIEQHFEFTSPSWATYVDFQLL